MKVLITGADGMLGRTLRRELKGCEIISTDRKDADITDAQQFDACVAAHKPDAVIHCAAMTAVDLCETEVDAAYRINAAGTANVAAACHRHGARLIAISTDYVFDGGLDRPYTEFDLPTGGNTVYGRSKWAGEQAVRAHCPNHVIARVSWLYGPGGPSFVHTMMKLADGTRPCLKVVDDQVGNPTSTLAVAEKLQEMLERPELVGTYHMSCEGQATWYQFARRIFELAGRQQQVVPCSTDEYPRPAPRPKNSRMDKGMLRLQGLAPMIDWEKDLERFVCREFSLM
ncbi:MAG: dTDP-4-dehydrorhamnose reductase [Duodenibacillus sp.]|nr:dTDP-4-dehydrorhamnose reductase [Duodenibacillus sp.]